MNFTKNSTIIETYPLETSLKFSDRQGTLHKFQIKEAFSTQQDAAVKAIALRLEVSAQQYHSIEKNQCFYLTREAFGEKLGRQIHLLADEKIELEITLRPDLLASLADRDETPQQLLDRLQEESRNNPTSQWLAADAWFCLSVRQQQNDIEAHYKTIWAYTDLSEMLAENQSPERSKEIFARGTIDFYQSEDLARGDREEAELFEHFINISMLGETLDPEELQILKQSLSDRDDPELMAEFQKLFLSFLADPENNLFAEDDILEELLGQIFQQAIKDSNEPEPEITILQQVADFFSQDDWHFSQIEELPLLRAGVRGNNGEWFLYAQTIEEQQRLLIYSSLPVEIAPEELNSIAEFTIRANSNMAIGNFELDWESRELRYKTSIDARGTELNSILIANLVYNNLFMSDRYLPGIIAVLESEMSPQEAISKIEDSENTESEGKINHD